MRKFFDLDEAVDNFYGDTDCGPDAWENVRENGRWITELTWYADEDGGKDGHEYIDQDGWTEWAWNRRYGSEAKIVKDGIVVYD